jgi:hypothetical protein
MAGYTVDAGEAVTLFRLALERYRSEGSTDPTYVTRLSMGARLIDLGRIEEARMVVLEARAEAEVDGNEQTVRFADSLIPKLAV